MPEWLPFITRKLAQNAAKFCAALFISHSAHFTGRLDAIGIYCLCEGAAKHGTLMIDPQVLTEFFTAVAFLGLHELHIYATAKWPWAKAFLG